MSQKSLATTSVGLVGLGSVRLPVVQHATRAGFSITGFDISKSTVESLNLGSSHIDDISDTEMQEMLDNDFSATHIQENFRQLSVYVICVPTPLIDGTRPDVSAIEAAGKIIAQGLSKGSLVILESTSYPGRLGWFIFTVVITGLWLYSTVWVYGRLDRSNLNSSLQEIEAR